MDHCDDSTSVVPVGDTSDNGAYVSNLQLSRYHANYYQYKFVDIAKP